MAVFAFIVLIVLLITLTHVHNWTLRLIHENTHNSDAGTFIVVTSIIYGLLAVLLLRYIILWGYPLITNM